MKVLNQVIKDQYTLYQGDCVEVIKGLPDDSIHYSIFSPPFASLYTYSIKRLIRSHRFNLNILIRKKEKISE